MARKINFDLIPDTNEAVAETRSPATQHRPLLGLGRPVKQSSALGAISQSLGGITEKVRRAEEIELKLVEGQVIVDLDPAVVDDSFVRDRMNASEEQNATFREMIREHGQAVPILVRPKADDPKRYEVAFGHRRLQAARDLSIKVRAVVRELTDEQLIVAQGQENSGRTDLTFIERARFAASLEDRKFSREVIMAALNVDKAALSRLIAAATRIPSGIIEAIGPAPAFGRVRWQELSDLIHLQDNRSRALAIINEPAFAQLSTDKRFEALYTRLRAPASRTRSEVWRAKDGTNVAKVSRSGHRLIMAFDDKLAPSFGEYVRENLQILYDEYKARQS